ncbi:hypothetical protein ACOSP7_009437 [Xanthoceras sorbifolium]
MPDSDLVCEKVNRTAESSSDSENTDAGDLPIAVRKGVRECRSRPLYPISKYVSYEGLSPNFRAFTARISEISVPSTVYKALKHSKWKEAVEAEISAPMQNQTWEITELPKKVTNRL